VSILPAARGTPTNQFLEEYTMNLPYVCRWIVVSCACLAAWSGGPAPAADPPSLPKAFVDGTGPGWKELKQDDFVNVNCVPDTWSWKGGVLHCTGRPIGVLRMAKPVTNFELVVQWRHLRSAGNSGVFVWAPEESLKALKPNQLPSGIEVQVLDHGYAEQYEKKHKKKPDWFTTNGDVFPVHGAKMKPFAPTSPDGSRSFPRKNLSKGVNEWNHYYVRGINGEVRLWVNGEEVSGGSGCEPRHGYLALESEGSPVEFRQIRLRELP
jgi:hypothetical protein